MIPSNQNSNYLRFLKIIHFALIAGPMSLALISLVLHQMDSFSFTSKDVIDILLYIVPATAIGGFLSSLVVFKKRLQEIKPIKSIDEKLERYRAALIVRYALLEGPSLLAIVAYLLTADFLFLGIAAIVLIYFASSRPTREKTICDLELESDVL